MKKFKVPCETAHNNDLLISEDFVKDFMQYVKSNPTEAVIQYNGQNYLIYSWKIDRVAGVHITQILHFANSIGDVLGIYVGHGETMIHPTLIKNGLGKQKSKKVI